MKDLNKKVGKYEFVQPHDNILLFYKDPDRPSGCVVMDRIIKVIAETRCMHASEVARAMNADLRDLSAVTYLMIGMRVGEIIDCWRFRQLCDVLRTTDLCLKDCALAVGYRSAETVCRLFDRHLGMTPEEWRKREKTAETSKNLNT